MLTNKEQKLKISCCRERRFFPLTCVVFSFPLQTHHTIMNALLTYDGSLEGLLTCVFEVYEHKLSQCTIQRESVPLQNLFVQPKFVETEPAKALRVWKGLEAKTTRHALHSLFCVYVSEMPNLEELFLGYAQYVFSSKLNVEKDYSNPFILQVSQVERKVHREKHRMEAFIRFKLTRDNIYFATIEPDFNVLPLIAKHFKKRYADQHWIIYDTRRSAGIYYNLNKVVDITFQFNQEATEQVPAFACVDEKEELYQLLWKDYFRTTNIKARKNLRLHLQHVPRRYWKYLTEKQ